MAYGKYLLPVLAAGHFALAQTATATSDACQPTGALKIQSSGDASVLASCKTFKGDIEIVTQAAGDITLNGVEQITGSVTSKGAQNVTSLTAPQLGSIGEAFSLNGLTGLTALNFGSLSSVGSIEFEALPLLQTLSFTKGVSKADSVSIVNTGLTSLDGISLESVGDFNIAENPALQTVNVNELKNSTGIIGFAGNLDTLSLELPNLETAANISLRNVTSVSVPSLHVLKGLLGLYGDSFLNFSAPNLTSTGDISFVGNTKLNNLSLPLLKTVNGGFSIARNDKLENISFPSLQTIGGALDFSGEFNIADLPALKQVKGALNIQSTGNFSCAPFSKLHNDGVVGGQFKCHNETAHPSTNDGSSGTSGTTTGTSSSASSTSSHSAAIANIVDVPSLGMAALFGALLQFVL